MSHADAVATVVRLLEQHRLQYVYFLNARQLRAMVDEYVRGKYKGRRIVRDDPRILNEIVAMMDSLIHLKGIVNQSIKLLEEGKAITLYLYDEEFEGGKFVEDIYVLVSLSLRFESLFALLLSVISLLLVAHHTVHVPTFI